MKTNKLNLAMALTLGAAMVTSVAFAKGKPTVELGNNLSFAAKIVGGGGPTLRATCSTTPTPPYGPQSTLYPGYWLQKTEAVWQAACDNTATTADVTATWGANLLGDASLKAGRPIRVEMTLTESGGTVDNPGYVVVNLTPTLDDRLSTYGTNGTQQFTNYTVYDNGAKLRIEQCTDEACTPPLTTILPEAIATAELNSLGNIVYGYNWGTKGKTNAPAAGIYKLTFTAKNTTIVSAPLAQTCPAGENCTYVIINVTPGGSGGGKPPGAGEGE
jgi:hypothetical protein